MIYQEFIPIPREQAELILSDTETNIGLICETLVRVAFFETDFDWVQGQCLHFCKHKNPDIRGLAVTCIGHLARIHGTLNMDLVQPVLDGLLNDAEIAGNVQDTLDDIEMFIGRS